MKVDFLKLVRKLLLLIVILVVLDRGIGFCVEKLFYTQKQGDASVTTYALNTAREDVLIFGTSRASHHYVSSIFKQETGLSTYNLGRDGIKFDYDYALITSVLDRYSPKVIIIDLSQSDFIYLPADKRSDIFTSIFLPYVNKSENIRKLVYEASPNEIYKATVSKLYPYNSLLVPIIQHHMGVGQKNDYGFEPLFGTKVNKQREKLINNLGYREDNLLVQKFDDVISLIEKRKIKLFVVFSPTLVTNKYSSITSANNVLRKYGLKVIDFRNTSAFNDSKLFHDYGHLNNSGAVTFTKMLLKDSIKVRM